MDGDKLYFRYYSLLAALTGSAMTMALADQLLLFWGAWTISDILLILLMVHKKEWKAATHSGYLAALTLIMGCISLFLGFYQLGLAHTIQDLYTTRMLAILPVALLMIAALSQSAIWPFHRWLLSSLNSPTPVSALMHAGLVNGGGILIIKFSPLFLQNPFFLNVIFVLGAFSAVIATIWKLMQPDIKKMLACSTLAQMGFMMMQCGLGLFAAAVAHLCWHGLFKAYLFLSSGSALTQNTNKARGVVNEKFVILISVVAGVLGALCFAWVSHKPFLSLQASTFVMLFAGLAGAQLMMSFISQGMSGSKIILGLAMVAICGGLYGTSIHAIEQLLPLYSQVGNQHLSILHLLVMGIFTSGWIFFNTQAKKSWHESKLWCRLYMYLWHTSQPGSQTVTSLRKEYQY